MKRIGEKAGWIEPLTKKREKLGREVEVFQNGTRKEKRFCDQMSSHMMRRTAVTTMLIFGMPEHLVRNISGHTSGSSSFYRYIHYARSFVDTEIDKVHQQLSMY